MRVCGRMCAAYRVGVGTMMRVGAFNGPTSADYMARVRGHGLARENALWAVLVAFPGIVGVARMHGRDLSIASLLFCLLFV